MKAILEFNIMETVCKFCGLPHSLEIFGFLGTYKSANPYPIEERLVSIFLSELSRC
jgi:hypothetical protein